jgi:hypothetical protein
VNVIDQNAFGLLLSFYDIEDAEYSLDPGEFVERCERFRELLLEHARAQALASGVSAVDLGHALYFEFEDGDQTEDPMAWLRSASRLLSDAGFAVAAVLAHGGRWVEEGVAAASTDGTGGAPPVVRVTRPSEALRRALYAEAATHGAEGDDGWGPGVFVDEEAIGALRRTFKNAPTALLAGGAKFFRLGS